MTHSRYYVHTLCCKLHHVRLKLYIWLDVIFIIGSHSYYHQHHIKHYRHAYAYSYHIPGSKCRLDVMFEKSKWSEKWSQTNFSPIFPGCQVTVSSLNSKPKFCNNYILSGCDLWRLRRSWSLIGPQKPPLDSVWLLSDEDSPLCHCDTIIISSHKIFVAPTFWTQSNLFNDFLTHSKKGLMTI